MEERKRIKHNRGKCRHCGDIIESVHRHDYVSCTCGAVAVDGGREYLRRTAKSWADFEELSEYEDPSDGSRDIR